MLNKSQLLTLQAICQKGLPVEKSASAWLSRLVIEEGIGQQLGARVVFRFEDIAKLKVFLAVNGYAQQVTDEDFVDRMTVSAVVNDEKLASSPITQDRVLVKSLTSPFVVNGKTFSAGHGVEFRVSELIHAEVSQVIWVENLAVFLVLHEHFSQLDGLASDVLAVYRGGQGIFSAQGSQAYLSAYTGYKIGFFDFDPAGICQLGMMGFDALMLPSIAPNDVPALLAANKSGVFPKQLSQYGDFLARLVAHHPVIAPWARLMQAHHLAVMQETLLSRGLPIVLVALKLLNDVSILCGTIISKLPVR